MVDAGLLRFANVTADEVTIEVVNPAFERALAQWRAGLSDRVRAGRQDETAISPGRLRKYLILRRLDPAGKAMTPSRRSVTFDLARIIERCFPGEHDTLAYRESLAALAKSDYVTCHILGTNVTSVRITDLGLARLCELQYLWAHDREAFALELANL